MKFTLAITTILSLSQAVTAAVFGPSEWDYEKARIVAIVQQRLDDEILYWTAPPMNLLTRMYQDGILIGNGTAYEGESALGRMLGLTTVDPVLTLIKPNSCREDSFGIGGNYTDAVCDTVDALANICANYETGCNSTRLQSVTSATSDQFLQEFTVDAQSYRIPEGASASLERKRNLMKTSVCIHRVTTGFSAEFPDYSVCRDVLNLPDAKDIAERVANYYSAMIYVKDAEFYNPLWTNTAKAASKEIDPDAWFVLGDGYLQLAELTWDKWEDGPTVTMNPNKPHPVLDPGKGHRDLTYSKTVVVDTIVHQYTNDHIDAPGKMFTDPDEDVFYRDVLHGYFYQRYSELLFPETYEKKMVTDGSMIRSSTKCAIPIGSLMAAKCGVVADDIHSYMTYYYANGLGSKDTYTANELCTAAPAFTNRKACYLVGGGRDNKCCRWNGSQCSSAIGNNVCITKFCKNFDREDLWKSKRHITNPDSFSGTKLSPAACFSLLGLV